MTTSYQIYFSIFQNYQYDIYCTSHTTVHNRLGLPTNGDTGSKSNFNITETREKWRGLLLGMQEDEVKQTEGGLVSYFNAGVAYACKTQNKLHKSNTESMQNFP